MPLLVVRVGVGGGGVIGLSFFFFFASLSFWTSFASGEYDKKPNELLHFLNELTDAGKLEHIGGMYSIAPR